MQLDSKSRWVGDSLIIPGKNVHLHLEPTNWLKNVQLTSGGNQQSYDGWRQLENELKKKLKEYSSGANLIAFPLLVASLGIAIFTAFWMLLDQESVAQALEELRRY
jgi:predicted PurR-regulated permease PerM